MTKQVATHTIQKYRVLWRQLRDSLHHLYMDVQLTVDATMIALWELEISQSLIVGNEELLYRFQIAL